MIKTINLTKKYDDMYAIRGIDLDLQQGDLFGFIGPNGAGKTTTMRIIATLLAPTYGEAFDLHPPEGDSAAGGVHARLLWRL
jgi:ABC-2 type transport system ATP-binding protein